MNTAPPDWIDGIAEWPTGVGDLRRLADALAEDHLLRIRAHWSPLLLGRNLLFLSIVLGHGIMRGCQALTAPLRGRANPTPS